MECGRRDSCGAWCIVESKMTTNFIVSPQDRPDTDTIECFTNRRPGNHILKATATSSPVSERKSASYLTQGIYNYDHLTTTCRLVEGSNPVYMLFTFDEEVLIRTIQMKMTDYYPDLPSSQTEILIGTSMPGGPTDFSQLKLVGTLDNAKVLEWRTFTVNPPKQAKFWKKIIQHLLFYSLKCFLKSIFSLVPMHFIPSDLNILNHQ